MPNDRCIRIAGKEIGPGRPAYVIAELSANHRQEKSAAEALVRAAADAGADAVKMQTYTPDTITIDCDNEYFRIKGTIWEGRTLYDLYAEAYTPWEWQPELKSMAEGLGLGWFSSPFDATSVAFLEDINAPAYKIASFELVDIPLLKTVAATGKPVIASTGMADLGEIEEAVRVLRNESGLALLHCVSAYPAPPEVMRLACIPHLAETFAVPAGLSDHTLGATVPSAAVALGACIVEKHMTLSRSDGGPDADFSLEPDEFREMVRAVREVEAAVGEVSYELGEKEQAGRALRRSLFVALDIAEGEPFTTDNVRSIRPANGLHTRNLELVLGRRATRSLTKGTPLAWDMVR